jgi:hypothetical protein
MLNIILILRFESKAFLYFTCHSVQSVHFSCFVLSKTSEPGDIISDLVNAYHGIGHPPNIKCMRLITT